MPYSYTGEYLDEDGDPVSGAKVIANRRSDGEPLGVVTTDDDGLFTIDSLEAPELSYVTVLQDGFIPQIFDSVTAEYYPIGLTPPVLSLDFSAPNAELSWTASDDITTEYQIWRSTNGGSFSQIDSVDGDTLSYEDTTITTPANTYSYYVVASDGLGSTGTSNTEDLVATVDLLFLVASTGSGGTTDRAIQMSADAGATWSSVLTPGTGQFFPGGAAFSAARGEMLFLGSSGQILRTTDGQTVSALSNDIGSPGGIGWTCLERVDAWGLYIAVGDGGNIKTSPTGEVWTTRASGLFSGVFQRVKYDSVSGRAWVGTQANSTQPLAYTTDGINYTKNTAAAGAFSVYEICFNGAGRILIGDRGDLSTVDSVSPYSTWNHVGGILGGQTFNCYDPKHDLLVSGSTAPGIFTSPATGGLVWTNRASTLHFQSVEDMVWHPTAEKLVGIRPISGSETAHQIITCSNGTTFVANDPGLATGSTYGRIVLGTFPAF